MSRIVNAGGTVPWRRAADDSLEVALVHRPKYDDWSWPKGKLEAGEPFCVGAVRETCEETGLEVALGLPLPSAAYPLGRTSSKLVRYWAATVVGGDGALVNEIDDVRWMSPRDAADTLTHARDVEQAEALEAAARAGVLDTWPLAIVRHARAMSRSEWRGADPERPLTKDGRARAVALGEELAAYGIRRLISSPSERCVATLGPYAAARGLDMTTKDGLSEEGFDRDPSKLHKHLDRAFERAAPQAICTHGPLLDEVFATLKARVRDDLPWSARIRADLDGLAASCQKGEIAVCHVTGAGEDARIVGLERLKP